jgi:hypothetical protein
MRYEVNVTTGEIIQREATAAELAQEALDRASAAAKNAERLAAEETAAAAKASARAKLAAIGLTEDEITALVGG